MRVPNLQQGNEMEHTFKAEEWKELRPADRAQRCRVIAREAQSCAQAAAPELAVHYEQIAKDWVRLADELERFRI